MSETDCRYVRLKKTANSLSGVMTSVYMSSDHILVASTVYFHERYKRFFFQDICSITVHRTVVGMVTCIVSLALALVFGLFAVLLLNISSGSVRDLGIFMLFPAVIASAVFCWSFFSGPTANAIIVTKTSRENVMIAGHLKQAVKIVEAITPMILVSQEAPVSNLPGQQGNGVALE